MSWTQICLDCDTRCAERLSPLLEQAGAIAVTLSDAGDTPLYEPEPHTTPLWPRVRVSALFEDNANLEAVIESLAAAVAPASLPAHFVEHLEDRRWERECLADFRPWRTGALWVGPSWCTPPEGCTAVVLDPGLAFGTGSHPSTRLCLEWLAGLDLSGRDVVDLGCGSGILGIAAARLGARRVYAVDIDPQALRATEDNAARNALSPGVLSVHPHMPEGTRAHVVVANILAGPLAGLAGRIAASVRPGGRLALSGLLERQGAALENAYSQWFDLEPAVRSEEWILLPGVRRSD